MANHDDLTLLKNALESEQVLIWNDWRIKNPNDRPLLNNLRGIRKNLSEVNLSQLYLGGAHLIQATLYKADFSSSDLSETFFISATLISANLTSAYAYKANFSGADLSGANLTEARLVNTDFSEANLSGADLSGADLSGARLNEANLSGTNLSGAILSKTDLSRALLVQTNLENALLEECIIYGISAWDVKLDGASQKNLNISPDGEPPITVDNLKIAQFLYLLLNNAEIRDAIDTITAKAVLILGRFKEERKVVLDSIRDELRSRGFLPILFDFDKPSSRDLTETVVTLAHLSRFVIADLTDPSSIPHELMSFTRDLPSVPVQPILLRGQRPYAMFLDHLGRYQHVLPVHEYESQDTLIAELTDKVIQPAHDKSEELRPKPF